MFSKISSWFKQSTVDDTTTTNSFRLTDPTLDKDDMISFGAKVAFVSQSASYADHQKAYDTLMKIILIGNSGVGKSSMLTRFANDTFTNAYKSTIGVEFSCRTLQFGDRTVKLQVWDTSGQERFRCITTSYYRGASGVMLCFSLNDPSSFYSVTSWLQQARDGCSSPDVPVLIVGCKSDLERSVSKDDAEKFAATHRCHYIEASAKDNVNVFEAFSRLAQLHLGVNQKGESIVNRKNTFLDNNQANVMCVDLGKLNLQMPLVTGEPVRCRECGVMFNKFSSYVLFPPSVKSHSTGPSLYPALEIAPPIHNSFLNNTAHRSEGNVGWKCEFCLTQNYFSVASEQELKELQQHAVHDFLVAPPAAQAMLQDAGATIFCIDVSGSMCVSSEVAAGNAPMRGSEARNKEFRELLGRDEQNQRLPGQRYDIAYVSRLQLLQGAIAAQVEELFNKNPKARVGIVSFADDVRLFGDKSGEVIIVAGDRLNDWNALDLVKFEPVFLGKKAILDHLWSLQESGQTALGPALQIAINGTEMGGTVVLATDGLANRGIGRLDEGIEDAKQFYIELGERCRVRGVTCNIVSLIGAECRLDALQTVVEQSRGTLERKEAASISKSKALVDKPIVASTVMTLCCLHRGLHFRNEADDELERRNWLCKDAGTVHKGDSVSFSFGFRPKKEFDLSQCSSVPFQLQVLMTRSDGSQVVRVSTTTMQLSADRAQHEASIDRDAVATNAAQKASKLAKEGQYAEASKELEAAKAILEKSGMSKEKISSTFSALESVLQSNNNNNNNAQLLEAMDVHTETIQRFTTKAIKL